VEATGYHKGSARVGTVYTQSNTGLLSPEFVIYTGNTKKYGRKYCSPHFIHGELRQGEMPVHIQEDQQMFNVIDEVQEIRHGFLSEAEV